MPSLAPIPVRVATSVVPTEKQPPERGTRLTRFLLGRRHEWALHLGEDGLSIEKAALGWPWSAVRGVRVFGGRGPTTLEITLSDGRLEAFGRFLPLTAAQGWSQARVRHLAAGLAEHSGVPLVDVNPPVAVLLQEAVVELRALARPTRDSHRSVFVSDRYPVIPEYTEIDGGIVLTVERTQVRLTRTHLHVGREANALSDIAAVDMVVEQERVRQTRGDAPYEVRGAICAVYQGRPTVLISRDLTYGRALQTEWLARQLDRAAAAVPFEDALVDVPVALQKLRGDGIP